MAATPRKNLECGWVHFGEFQTHVHKIPRANISPPIALSHMHRHIGNKLHTFADTAGVDLILVIVLSYDLVF